MTPYRDCTEIVAKDVLALAERRQLELEETPRGWRSIYVRRQARIAFGVAGMLGAVATLVVVCIGFGYPPRTLRGLGPFVLLATWPAALVTAVAATAIASLRLEHLLRRGLVLRGEPFADLETLRAFSPRRDEARLSRANETASIAWPLTAAALLGPLSLHLAVAFVFGMVDELADFEEWMVLSGVIVGHVHVYMVYLSWRFPTVRRPWRGLMVAVVWSLFPGALLVGLPPLLVTLTGGALVLLFFLPLGAVLDHEREALAGDPAGEGAISLQSETSIQALM